MNAEQEKRNLITEGGKVTTNTITWIFSVVFTITLVAVAMFFADLAKMTEVAPGHFRTADADSDAPSLVSLLDVAGSEAVVTEVIGMYHGVQIVKITSGDAIGSTWENIAIASRTTIFTKGSNVNYGVIKSRTKSDAVDYIFVAYAK